MTILSPAGSYQAMVAAVSMGANGVYLGLDEFSARAGAKNFTPDSLREAVLYCHKRNAEVFVALNTIVYDNEIGKVKKLIECINESMADGIIVQDLGVYEMAKAIAPELRIVASTQMTVNNVSGTKLISEKGFDTLVLPRELSYKDIKEVKKNTDIKLEAFCHGALCVSYSGQCLMSSFIGERSGNRGKCAQPCRMMYSTPNKEGYFLSPCDLSLVNRLDKMKEAGVDILKIEGRLKSEFYTAAITDVYRRVLDSGEPPAQEDFDTINASFLRGGYTTGYFDEITDRRLFNFNKKETPYSRESERLENKYKQLLSQKDIFFKTTVSLEMDIEIGKNISGNIKYSDKSIEFTSKTIPCEANKAPVSEEKIIEQLSKTGNEAFDFSQITLHIKSDNIFISISDVNNIRREIGIIIDKSFDVFRESKPFTYNMQKRHTVDEPQYYCTVHSAFQMKWIKEFSDMKIFAPLSAIEDYKAKKYGDLNNVGIFCRRIVSDADMNKIKAFLVKNPKIKDLLIGNIGYIKKFKDNYNLYGDFSLNITNSLSAQFYENEGILSLMASVEANIKNIKNIITKKSSLSVTGYGKIPLMITGSCIKTNIRGKCQKIPIVITDRKGEEFVIECEDCGKNAIYNQYPIMMADKLNDIRAAGINQICLRFTDENKAQVEEILRAFKLEINPLTKFTRGHFYRGAY